MTRPLPTAYRAGDLVRVAYTFTNQTGWKTRPAVVLSVEKFNTQPRADVILMPLSRQAGNAFAERPVLDWRAAGLDGPTNFKAQIQTLEQSSIFGFYGHLSDLDRDQLKEIVRMLLHACE